MDEGNIIGKPDVKMMRICECFFSPCGNVRKIVETIGNELSMITGTPVSVFDFTKPSERSKEMCFGPEDLVILGSPVYAGRVPNKIMPYIKDMIKGEETLCICVVSYGNRSYDNALSELAGLASDNGMKVFAAAAVASEHSFVDRLASGHPNEEDCKDISKFARNAYAKLEKGDFSTVNVPGIYPCDKYYTPLKEDGTPAIFLKAVPKIDTGKCTGCGKCATVCPMGSISVKEPFETVGICIKCQACIKACPNGARFFDNEDFLSHCNMLRNNYSVDKKNEFYY